MNLGEYLSDNVPKTLVSVIIGCTNSTNSSCTFCGTLNEYTYTRDFWWTSCRKMCMSQWSNWCLI